VTGVVSKVSSGCIDLVSQSGDDLELAPPLRLDLLASEATFKKLKYALNDLEALNDGHAWPIADTIFNGRVIEEPLKVKIEPANESLNMTQVEAIEVALGAKYLSLIHGPPGTILMIVLVHGHCNQSGRNGENHGCG